MIINEVEYELIKNNKDGFNEEEILNKVTDYFYNYDYIFGDWAYGKLRLKGFYENNNKLASNINKIDLLDSYIENNCAYGCRYFLLKKKKSEVKK